MSSSDDTTERWNRLNGLCDRFEDAWISGAAPRIEDYLVEVPDAWKLEAVREFIKIDLQYRRDAGLSDSTADYFGRFPEIERHWFEQMQCASSSVGTPGKSFGIGRNAQHSRLRPVLPGYEILEVLGRGGMGVVYRARQINLDRIVAIKMIISGELASPEMISRFHQEARAAAQLQHPNLVQVYEVGEFGGRLYQCCEYVEGGSLDKRLAGLPQLPIAAAKLVREIANATQFAHNRSIVHRDLKPGNILLVRPSGASDAGMATSHGSAIETARRVAATQSPCVEFGPPKIADFGLAKNLETDSSATKSGAILGSPSYMAPEQAAGESDQVGPACDVYALGAILYEMLTGRPPFRAPTVTETLEMVRTREPIPPSQLQPSIPKDLETICLKCLQKEARHRYASAGDLVLDLERYLRDEPVHARRVSTTERTYRWCRRHPWVAGLTLMLLFVTVSGVAGVWWQWSEARRLRELAEENADRFRDQRDEADRQRVAAIASRERAEKESYFRLIGQAYGELQMDQVGRASKRLQECPESLRGWEWSFLTSQCHQEIIALAGHKDEVWSLAASRDGKTLISGSGVYGFKRPGEIIVWDVQTGQKRTTIRGHHAPIMSLACNHDASRIVSCSERFEDGGDGLVKIWDGTGNELRTLPSPARNALAVEVSGDGKTLAVAGFHPDITLWDLESGQFLRTISGHTGNIFGLAISPDGQWVASVGNDGTVRVNDIKSGELIVPEMKGFGALRKVLFSPDGRYLVFSVHGRFIYRYDFGHRDLPPQQITTDCSKISSISISQEGRRMLVAGYQGECNVLSLSSGVPLRRLRTHDGAVNAAVFFDGGKKIATGGNDQFVKIWDGAAESRSSEVNLAGLTRRGSFSQIKISRDGKALLLPIGVNWSVGGSGSNELLCWDMKRHQPLQRLSGHEGGLSSVDVSPNGLRYVTGSLDRTARIWNASSGTCEQILRGHQDVVSTVSFSPDGLLIATGSHDGSVRIWDSVIGKLQRDLRHAKSPVTRLAFRPNSNQLAAATSEGKVFLWSSIDGSLKGTVNGHSGSINAMAYHPMGTQLATGGEDQVIRIWDPDRLTQVRSMSGHNSAISDLGYSPSGDRIATAGRDHLLKLWDTRTGGDALTLRMGGPITAVVFHPDGNRLITAEKTVLTTFEGHPSPKTEQDETRFLMSNLGWHEKQAREAASLSLPYAAKFHLDNFAKRTIQMNTLESLLSPWINAD